MLRKLFAIALIVIFSHSAFSQTLQKGFQSPPNDSRIMMRWWWFGPAVTKAEIERELRTMRDGGIGGVEVQPVYPLMLDDAKTGIKNIPFLSDEFLDMLRFTADKSKELGMRMDLTLGSGWSFGGPNVPLREANTQLKFEKAKIDDWDRLVLVTKANNIHSVQFKIFDVDRRDFWDKVKEFVAPIIQSLFGFVAKASTAAIPKPIAFLTGAFGTAIEDVESYTLKKLANGEDRLLCKGTFDSFPSAVGTHLIAPKIFVGSKGNYDIGLELKVS